MRQFCVVAVLAGMLACGSTVSACLNDVSLPQREGEFRSQYQSDFTTQIEPQLEQPFDEKPYLAIAGSLMLVGAGLLTLFGARKAA